MAWQIAPRARVPPNSLLFFASIASMMCAKWLEYRSLLCGRKPSIYFHTSTVLRKPSVECEEESESTSECLLPLSSALKINYLVRAVEAVEVKSVL